MRENNFEHSREAAKITLDKVKSWEDLNAATMAEADEKFKEVTKETWKDFAISGTLQFDQKEGKQVLRPFTDLDGRSAIAILQEAGIDTSNLTYVKPGEFLKGAINLDTGDKFGVIYEEPIYTAYFDHHAKSSEVTSTTEIMYQTMVDLGMMEKSPAMDRLVKFVTDIDNRKLPAEEFLKSGKTIIGVQRDLDFAKMLAYFSEHESPTDILTPEEFEKYGLRDSSERQQRTVDESMARLAEMEKQGKVIDTKYGKVVVNENNELRTGSSAAYVKHDGIVNFTPDKSFAVTFKDKNLDEQALRQKLGDKFQGKIIRGKMWIYNDNDPLKLSLDEILDALKGKDHFMESEIRTKLEYIKSQFLPHYSEIQALRQANEHREVGGHIIEGKLTLHDESRWGKNSVSGFSYEQERSMTVSGSVSFHTHPGQNSPGESPMDIVATYYRLGEVIVENDGTFILFPEKNMTIEEIQRLDKEAGERSEKKELEFGDEAYWFWKEFIKDQFPTRRINIRV